VFNSFVSRVKGQTEKNSWQIEYLQKFSKCKNNKKSPNYLQKVLSHANRWKNAVFIANNVILWFFFCVRPIVFHKFIKPLIVFFTKTKKYVSYDFDEPSSIFFKSLSEWPYCECFIFELFCHSNSFREHKLFVS
jgi:hypothetical protein